MSTTRIVTIACWIVTALVLIGLVVWFLTSAMFTGWSNIFRNSMNFGLNFGRWDNLSGPFEVDGVYNISASGVDTIRIDWVAGEVTITPHDGDDIQITESARRELGASEKLRYTINGSALEIRFLERGSAGRNTPEKRLEVLVPHELSENIQMLSVETVSGGFNISGISASRLRTSSASGGTDISGTFRTVEIENISGGIRLENYAKSSTANIESVSGRIELSGAFERVDIDSVSGSISITSTEVPSSLRINSVSGSVNITLPADAIISINHSSVSGRLTSDIPITMDGRDAQFRVSTVSGNTRIHTLDE